MLSADTCWFSDGGRSSGSCQGHELMMHSRAVLKTHPPSPTLTLGLHVLADGWRVSLLSLQTMGAFWGGGCFSHLPLCPKPPSH